MSVGTLEVLKQRERESRRELIISAAQALFSRKDFRNVTAREIAKEAGVSPGTIYRYYTNLDDLFMDIFLDHVQMIGDAIDETYDREEELSVPRFCKMYVTYLNENMAFYQMMSHFMLNGNLPTETAHRMDPIMRELMDRLERILQNASKNGTTRFSAHALFSSLNGVMISYARYPGRSLDEIRRHTLRLADVIARQFSTA
ncbi:MAG: TetR/AcrR family transcriptional regulator [Proteobacteria bacterium]|nr:TetR/AcrR family transcriptional regulator [Pseudomonadota bacterium]